MSSSDPNNTTRLTRFAGEATILMADVSQADSLAGQLGPEGLVAFLEKHVEKQNRIISRHGGVVVQFVGSYINALWRDSDHALKAVDAARAMLSAADDRIDYHIAIATESVIGDFFGPIKQYQLLGRAMEQADRLLRFPLQSKRSLLVTERTLQLIVLPEGKYTQVGLLKNQGNVFSLSL
jgi:class 3 adenylate cyclase